MRDYGAEAILHGHIHKQAVRSLPSRAARTVGGAVPVLGAPSAAAAARDPRYRAAYHLVRLDREGERWLVSARARGLGAGKRGDRRTGSVERLRGATELRGLMLGPERPRQAGGVHFRRQLHDFSSLSVLFCNRGQIAAARKPARRVFANSASQRSLIESLRDADQS